MKTIGTPTYYLGSSIDGRVYLFLELGDRGAFPTVEEAITYARSKPRSGVWLVYETAELYKNGVNYGSTGYRPVATAIVGLGVRA